MKKRPGISDIASRLGISIATVSNALNGKKTVSEQTRKKVVAMAKKIGYGTNSKKKNSAYPAKKNSTIS